MRPLPALSRPLILPEAQTRQIERALGDALRALLPAPLREPVLFVAKHLWAGLFGGILLLAIWLSSLVWQPGWALARHDALFLLALAVQMAFLALRLETRAEGLALLVFSALGLGLELYNTARGSWVYPQAGVLSLGGVPLVVGFMYAAVGQCVLRMIRIFDMRFAPFPPRPVLLALAAAIYANFFTQHLWIDLRLGLFAATLALFWRTRITFRATPARWRSMPMLLSLILSALGVWLAENIGALTETWLYHGRQWPTPVDLATLGSWYLFLCVALAVAMLVQPRALQP